jgi:hypothetical protein
MSDSIKVINRFVGKYVAEELTDPVTPQNKKKWVPKAGVAMEIVRHDLKSPDGSAIVGAYAKVKLSTQPAIEDAIYRVVDERLIASNIELETGLLLTETLRLMKFTDASGKERVGVEHNLQFSDGDQGRWICPK